MKPEALKPSPRWTEKKIWIDDHVWYIPSRSDATPYSFPGWTEVFGNSNPVFVEYCSGNGAWVAARAHGNPLINWVAVERKFSRVRKIWSKTKKLLLKNLLTLCGEGQNATQRFFPSDSVDQVFINFPDPWPKTRHIKYRLINPDFVNELCRILKPGGRLTIVTDDPGYSEWILNILRKDERWRCRYPEPFFSTEYQEYGTSYFEDLWRSKGLVIRYHEFTKEGQK